MQMLQEVGWLISWLIGWFTEVVVLLSYMEEKPASNIVHMQMLQEVGCLIGWFTEVVMLLSYMEEKPLQIWPIRTVSWQIFPPFIVLSRHMFGQYINSVHVVSHL